MTSSSIQETLTGIERTRGPAVDISNHHYISLSQLNKWISTRALPHVKGVTLDYGCGGQPYREWIESRASRYIGADVAAAADVSLDVEIVPGQPLALADGSIQTIFATQTLEHVYDIETYLKDCLRLLCVDGSLILSVPMQWRHHEEPFDFWRFTRYGIERKLTDIGFVIEEMVPCGGVYSLLAQIYLNHLAARSRLRPYYTRIVNRIALWLDRRASDYEDTLLWMCIAKKSVADAGRA